MSTASISAATNLRSNSTAVSFSATPHRKNAAQPVQRSESPYQQRTSAKDNPTQQAIKQAVDFLIEQLQQGKSEMLTALSDRNGAVPFLLLRQYPFDCEAETGCHQSCWHPHVERAWPLCEEGRKGHSDSRAHDGIPPPEE